MNRDCLVESGVWGKTSVVDTDLPKDGKHQVSIMNWVKDIEAEAKTRGLDAMFYVDENIRNVGNVGHVARFVSVFTHFGKVSIKDAEDCVGNITAGNDT